MKAATVSTTSLTIRNSTKVMARVYGGSMPFRHLGAGRLLRYPSMKHLAAAAVLVAHLMTPMAAWAQDKAKNPLDYSLKQYAMFLGAALLGGFVSWYSKVRSGVIPAMSINHLVGELCTSAFAGLLCFWICEWSGFPQLLTAALTGIMGHMGTRGITMLEDWAAKKLGSATDTNKVA